MNWILLATLLVPSWLTVPTDAGSAHSTTVAVIETTIDGWPQLAGTPISSAEVMRPEGEDATCSDFADQAAAQTALDADPRDPHGLDLDLDGIACETPFVTPAVPAAVPTAPPASLDAPDVDCSDFTFQEDAQVVLDHIPGDPYNLDPSGDGLACSSLPSRDG
jgi:hypothetical protein